MQHHQDTTRRRKADSVRLLLRLEKLQQHGPLWFHTVPLWPGSVWSASDIEGAKLAAQTIMGGCGAPGWVRLERGRCGGLHLHIVTPAHQLGPHGVAGGEKRRVYDLPKLAAYLSKPHDARLCRAKPVELARFGGEERRRQFLAAIEQEAKEKLSRHGRRCQARSWTFRAAPGWRSPLDERYTRPRLSALVARLSPLSPLPCLLDEVGGEGRCSSGGEVFMRPERWQVLGVFRAGVGGRGRSLVMA